ncbi:MAG: carbamate kinase [Thermoplasmata archaeon HGW-Thermoplasmata-1]|nr:MAG: carbamate kinase [Thermoplasmata archaeon HGW-Thermoplasmata-1]
MTNKGRAVIALGGNALVKPEQKGTIYEQFANTRETSAHIVKMIKAGWEVVITHGNGPQVGAILIQNERAKNEVPAMPLGICVAESEGVIGYMIQQCLSNALRKADLKKPVVALVTQVLVDDNDPSFSNPTKPIGPYYTKKVAEAMRKAGQPMMEQRHGWRMIVPSPDPKAVVEADVIKKLMEDGIIVIASGGGGMPVIEKPGWGLDGLEAVIDKDLASERLAHQLGADLLLILTGEDNVCLNYGKPDQRILTGVTLAEIKAYYEAGHFPPGSMGPKILAAIRFLEGGGKRVAITSLDKAYEAAEGRTGTQIVS